VDLNAAPSEEFLSKAVFLVDSSSYIFRAYYGIMNPLTAPDGTPTHATFGFLQMLQSLFRDHRVERCALVWDRKEKGFRHEIFPEYKANRAIPPEDLGIQIENSREGADLFGLPQFDFKGFEADDVLATLVTRHPEQNFVIVTGDKDLLQLVGPNVWCLDTLKNQWGGPAVAELKFGVPPAKIKDVQAISGDSVDNIPGAPGIGPKGAAQLITEFGSLENVLQEAERRWGLPEKERPSKDCLKGKKLESIATNIEKIRLSLKLVSLSTDVPIELQDEVFRVHDSSPELRSWAEKMGFGKVVETLDRILHPMAKAQPQAVFDLAPKAVRSEFQTIKNLGALDEVLKKHTRATLVALDTETRGKEVHLGDNLVGISFCASETEAYYIPLRHDMESENLPLGGVVDRLQKFLYSDNPLAKIVFQNAKFDLHVLARENLRVPLHRIEDTMIASFVVNPSERHGMDELAVRYLAHNTIKFKEVLGERKTFAEVPIDQATQYAAEDAWVTFRLWGILKSKLESTGLWPVYDLLDRPLISLLQTIEETGVLLDVPYLRELSKELHLEMTAKEAEAIAILKADGINVGPGFNLNSPKQIAKVLFEELKLPVIKKGKTGPSTDVSVMEELALKHRFPRTVLEIRELAKLLGTYVDALPELVEGGTSRLHTDFSQTIAVTGRLASSNPNLQNIPIRTERGKKIRYAFTVQPGYYLLGIDYSQIELRVLAHMSEDPELVKAFQENADIHRRTAALVFQKTEEQISSDERRMAKAINFGIVYGQTAFGLAGALQIDRRQAQNFIDGYFKTYPKIKGFMESLIEGAREKGFVKTLTGRVRFLPDIHSKNPSLRNFAERTAINSPLQGTAADLMKAAMIRVQKELLSLYPESKLILQVHDELLFEVQEKNIEEFKKAAVAILERRTLLAEFGCGSFIVPMKADASTGRNWGELD
jgi:DNA polymerase I